MSVSGLGKAQVVRRLLCSALPCLVWLLCHNMCVCMTVWCYSMLSPLLCFADCVCLFRASGNWNERLSRCSHKMLYTIDMFASIYIRILCSSTG